MSRWFRHYAGMMRDDKLVRAALKAGQPVERVLWVWGAILESAAEIDDGGRYELDHAECAYFLRVDEGDIAAIENALQVLGRVREGTVGKWGDRQFQSDRSAERQQRYRERHRRAQATGGDGGQRKSRNVTVTASSRAPEGFFTPASYRMPSHEWAVVRRRIFERDDYSCRYCGERGGRLECDHVRPVARGGDDSDANLVTACFACNRSKRDKLLSEWLQ